MSVTCFSRAIVDEKGLMCPPLWHSAPGTARDRLDEQAQALEPPNARAGLRIPP